MLLLVLAIPTRASNPNTIQSRICIYYNMSGKEKKEGIKYNEEK